MDAPAVPVATTPPPGPAALHPGRRRRRPSGAAPPLPHKIGRSGTFWLLALVIVAIPSSLALTAHPWIRLADLSDTWWLRQLARLRVGWLTTAMRGIKIAGSGWPVTVLGTSVTILAMAYRRWRHLLVFFGSVLAIEFVGGGMVEYVARPRPYGVSIISGWGGFSLPSPPVGILGWALMGGVYMLVVPGRPRAWAKWGAGAVLVLVGFARQYLGVDHATDVIAGVVFGVGLPVLAFRMFTPNEVFPVRYRQGRSAHLDVTGRRGEAIKAAVQDQLGLTVLEIKPVGLEGSGGSTPLRLKVEGDPDQYLFAKLYAKNHVRADRWYKVGRTILYGRLEDEAPFHTVRRFVEYEDYTLRLLRDSGILTAAPFGFVEITPEREYMLVTQFFDGAAEIGEADVDDAVIDEGLSLIRKLWDAGIAHRDIKPANLLVKDDKVILIDAFFVQVRPSPWRQAVDLANMMLVLAVRTDPERVYERALQFFSPDEIAEAFAATRGVASPTQLGSAMKRDGRDLMARFRALAPPRRPIAIQRWSFRRVVLAVGVAVLGLILTLSATNALLPAQNLSVDRPPECRADQRAAILMAQAIPSATMVPCIATLPSGWTFGGASIHSGKGRFWLSSDQAGFRAVTVTLYQRCDVAGSQRVPTDEPDTTRFENPTELTPDAYTGTRTYRFPGGCAVYSFSIRAKHASRLVFDVEEAVGFLLRADLVQYVRDQEDLELCGAGAPCPG